MRKSLTVAAAFVLALVLILSCPGGTQASTRFLLAKAPYSSVASQALKDLKPDRKDPFNKVETVESSFQKIPPSKSNPIQNK
ncbi:hypothetical protein U1Q18_006317 [Sarracenia purpurea var. burkii]